MRIDLDNQLASSLAIPVNVKYRSPIPADRQNFKLVRKTNMLIYVDFSRLYHFVIFRMSD
jgi:hypothetical protein